MLFYKATLTKVFNITVSWIRLAKSIALEFLLIVTLSLVAVTLWQLLV
ncbi:hypothetical protein JCM19236_6376 [Vibrio sp. JCM 19236]|nr:hypothetical protein JCM19236_6376 [Vibrio sp. JCM 19236]